MRVNMLGRYEMRELPYRRGWLKHRIEDYEVEFS